MTKKFLMAFAAVFVLSIGVAVYAFNANTTTTNTAAASCCCKGDSCPMKSKDAKATADAKDSCCKDDCCKGDSCPMKAKADSSTAAATATATEHSCPMMKDGKMAEMKKMHAEHKDGHEGCSCACCGHEGAK